MSETTGTPAGVLTYLPENLDFGISVPAKWHEYAAWFVGGLYLRRHTEKYADPDDYRRVSSAALRQVLPKRDYTTILGALVATGVVECEGGYWAGTPDRSGWSRGFRLARMYREAPFRRVRLTHPELVRKVAKLRRREDAREVPATHWHLRDALSRLAVADGAPDELPLARVRDRDFAFTVCRYGRVHTNLTNLSSSLRPYLRVNDRPLWGVDIVNSQPLLLGLTLAEEDGPLAAEIATYREWLEDRTASPQSPPPRLTFPPPYLGTYSGGGQSDLAEYVRLCLDGAIYEALMAATGLDRPTVKREFFKVAYGRPRDGANTPLGKVFRATFPDCWAGMCRMKAGGHQKLARQMQVVESYVVIWRTCRRLAAECPTAPLLTLHDSLVTDEEHIGAFERALVDEFRVVFGIEPRVQTKSFAAPRVVGVDGPRHAHADATQAPALAC